MATSFSTVIVTRNRAADLALSLPLHLKQSRLPERILIIDSSDDLSANQMLVERLASVAPIPVEHQPAPPGMTVQRNIGLAKIRSDVVFFPDDDSLVHPDALARIMHIYDTDQHCVIGGVCAVEATHPPQGVFDTQSPPRNRRGSIRAYIAPLRTRLEDRMFPDPMKLVAQRLQSRLPQPEEWLAAENAVRVEWMTGFRMSFRSSVIQQVGFNENLGRYALYEDIDAGLRVLANGYSLVAARNASIYHHKAPERRTGGRQMGVINILNRAYVTMRTGVADESVKAALKRHARFRVLQFSAGTRSSYGKERLSGAKAAYDCLPTLLASEPSQLDDVYNRLRENCLAGET